MKKIAILVLGLMLVAAACNRQPTVDDMNPNPVPTQDNNGGDKPAVNPPADVDVVKTYEIKMTNNGFEPNALTLKKGDIVKFVNNDDTNRWPASAPHPTHTDYPELDAKQGIAPGQSWSFTFNKTGTWKFHDHLTPSMFGIVTVK